MMNKGHKIKIIKNVKQVIVCQVQPTLAQTIAVQSWISEFQKRRNKSLPPFDSVFK